VDEIFGIANELTQTGDEESLRMRATLLLAAMTLAEAKVRSCLKEVTSARERLEVALTPKE
jgi:hypothetical protein